MILRASFSTPQSFYTSSFQARSSSSTLRDNHTLLYFHFRPPFHWSTSKCKIIISLVIADDNSSSFRNSSACYLSIVQLGLAWPIITVLDCPTHLPTYYYPNLSSLDTNEASTSYNQLAQYQRSFDIFQSIIKFSPAAVGLLWPTFTFTRFDIVLGVATFLSLTHIIQCPINLRSRLLLGGKTTLETLCGIQILLTKGKMTLKIIPGGLLLRKELKGVRLLKLSVLLVHQSIISNNHLSALGIIRL